MSAFAKIEVENSYRGTIIDATVSKSSGGFPQAVIRFRAEEAANEKGEWEALAAQAQITAYFTLFNNVEIFNEQTANLNYGQLQKIGGWEDGKFSFREIPKLNGKKCFFRTELNTYTTKAGVEKTAMQVVWVDEYESDGTTTLKAVSDAELDAFDAMLKFTPSTTAPKAQAAKRGRPAKAEMVATNPTSMAQAVPVTGAKPTPSTSGPSKVLTVPPADETPQMPSEEVLETTPATCTKPEAWEYLYRQCKASGDDAITQAWLGAIQKVGGDQKTYTGTEWARVRDTARAALIPFKS